MICDDKVIAPNWIPRVRVQQKYGIPRTSHFETIVSNSLLILWFFYRLLYTMGVFLI
ncbi:hypothetical protein BDQ94DRAFT_155453 [Aspergillus welwitschiae]|uniref:Uncharacterized protein n=1 Tax=Aspergillus welwitschiae TaxID=1341132 RepID=A0A3F3PHR7_9EURO|nr:hypothetical protein BDQ94DRAFT_155453 [Aspergillus welwitschiae]RDH26500.1 hypothetical protein BDQ94DRAFT_155453 [Aspergillus welwitschiae]